MRKEELRTYIEKHESEMIEDLKSLIRIPSEKQEAEPGKPFGAPAAEALAQGIEILEKYGFAVTNYDNYAIAADFNQEEKGLDILAHLDVVPAGEGWQETDPFTPLIKEGKMFGRGTADDKGPAIAAIYAMRAVKELGYPLKKNVRLVLGSDEECLSHSRCFLHHFRLLRMVRRPARNPVTRHTSTSAWSCFDVLPHLGSGTAFIYARSCFV